MSLPAMSSLPPLAMPCATVLVEGLSAMVHGLAQENASLSLGDHLGTGKQRAEQTQILPQRFPQLAYFFQHAERQAQTPCGNEQSLWHLLGYPPDSVPVAFLGRWAEQGLSSPEFGAERFNSSGTWLRADPVWLRADLSRVFLAGDQLALSVAEHQSLAQELKPHLHQAGWHLHLADSGRWYLERSASAAAWPFVLANPSYSLGHDLHELLPAPSTPGMHEGHQLFNEMQMLLFQHPVNLARRARGLPEANSLWFWGGGEWPENFSLRYQLAQPKSPELVPESRSTCALLLRALATWLQEQHGAGTWKAVAAATPGPCLWHWSPQIGELPSEALTRLNELLRQASVAQAITSQAGLRLLDDEGHAWYFNANRVPRPWQRRYWQRPVDLVQQWRSMARPQTIPNSAE